MYLQIWPTLLMLYAIFMDADKIYQVFLIYCAISEIWNIWSNIVIGNIL